MTQANKLPISQMTLKEMRLQAGLTTQQEAAGLCGIGLKSYLNWERGKRKPPPAVFTLISIYADLGVLHEAWRNWRIHGDSLHTDTGLSFRIGEIRHLELLGKYIDYLKAENKRLSEILLSRTPLMPCKHRQPWRCDK